MCDERELQWLAITSFDADRICPCVDHVAGKNFGVPCPLPDGEFQFEQLFPAPSGATRIYRFPTRMAAEGFARGICQHFHSVTESAGIRYRLILMGVGEGVVGRDGCALRDRAGQGKSNNRGLAETPLRASQPALPHTKH
jgi:hypothetical protein